VPVPALIYAANVETTHGDSRLLSAFVLLALTGACGLLLAARPGTLRETAGGSALAGGLLGALLFAPAQAHGVALGFSGCMWITSNLLAVAAFVAGARHLRDGGSRPLLLAFAAAGIGLLTYSTSVAVVPLLLLAALAVRRRPATVAPLALATLAVVGGSSLGYRRPPSHPEIALDPLAVAGFALRYLGGPFAAHPAVAAVVGGAGVLAGALLWATRRRSDAGALLPWALLQGYGLVNAAGTALGRAGMVPDQSLSSRYSTVAVLFWAGLLVPLAELLFRRSGGARGRRLAAACVAGAAIVALLWVRGAPVLAAHLRRAAAEGVAEAALRVGVGYPQALRPVTHAPAPLWRLRGALRARRHVPFDRPAPAALGAPVDPARIEHTSPLLASRRERRRVRGGWQVSGRAAAVEPPLRWLVLVDRTGRACGLGAPGEPRRDPRPARAGQIRWTGFAADCAPGGLRAFALLGESSRLRPVRGRGWLPSAETSAGGTRR
jgi:hypothetical protein